ncbi:ABC transporter ATP-binding protein [Natranaerobius thermophilus]|uniref:Oligopeptide/dipeptide ABC transporter, ATPase subunit n=1 Tax=Natranaerobius thermophilus (strain ATCC BAA-1301 / DSM 18059 / JW/NM-WN-LF) TaxID=457570 RepID=B2A2W6_NATTJ|nr:oligopeptide/dipeptide ABC transporter ATP-binding protein [Natranaerobius thermophilus]ACB86334.1 oligopeptide/dipeptide ABC transporter, ATPase subunit [Natranaerobius thermophilus JW/NM-WN-LF]
MSDGQRQSPILEVEQLSKYFQVSGGGLFGKKQQLQAVDNVNFKLYPGETLGIVGESGCGKSTTGNLMTRLLEPTKGKIYFEGEDFTALKGERLRERRKDMQMIFQDPFSSLNPRMKVFDIIAEPLKTHGMAKGEELRFQVYQLLSAVGLGKEYANRYPHEFSGGQRQRIGIARALALKPKLIICDEPVSALDVSIQSQILQLLKKLQKEYDLTYIFIGHGLPAVKYISDRIAVMYLGKLVELASSEELFRNPKHPYTKGLLSALPISDPELRNQKSEFMLEGDLPSPVNPPRGCSFHTRCPFSQEVCTKTAPPERTYYPATSDERLVTCHFPLEDYNQAI